MVTPPSPPLQGAPRWMSELLGSVLDKAVAILGANAPARRYVSAGEPAMDCQQLTVHLQRLRPSQRPTGSQQTPISQGGELITIADVAVTLYRCVTTLSSEGKIPEANILDAEGRDITDLGASLWMGLLAATIDGSLFPALVRPPVMWREGAVVNPQAGLAGWKATMEVTLA